MPTGVLKACIFMGCFLLASITGSAQEVVHALTGSVVSVDAVAKTITVFTDSHSNEIFRDMRNSNTSIDFDKSVRIDSTPADDFQKSGAYAVVFYYGAGDARAVVALRGLGAGPFAIDTGTVTKFENNEHIIFVREDSGALKSFRLASDTVAETSYGAVGEAKYQPHNGDQIRITSALVNGSPTALFINALVSD